MAFGPEGCNGARMNDTPPPSKVVTISDITLRVLADNSDAQWYGQRGVFEEHESLLYPMIRRGGFRTFIDVGSNYGFVSILACRAAPEIELVVIEADARLIPLIEENLESNGIANATVIHAIAGSRRQSSTTFSLNPVSTLDNRVSMDGWIQQAVQQRSLDEILAGLVAEPPYFFKIDTQGFESEVLAGASRLLTERRDWMIKMEFAPSWLRSQSVDPTAFLSELCEQFEVAEFPARVPYFTKTLESLFDPVIDKTRVDSFVQYVEALNRDHRGWVELLVRAQTRQ